MFNFTNRVVFAAMALLIGLWVAPAAMAQEAPKADASQKQANVSDKELKSFAKAYVDYHKIRQSYEKQLNTIQDPAEKEKVQREGNAKVSKALEKQGLTPESYNRVFSAVNNNEQLRKKTLKLIEDERKNS
ncbi:MAG TPA: DUF4168 domain-containing protein [Candidatus Binatia bacterium]|jgi:hypothetical protein